jgi:hypothetical protein
MNTVQTGPEMDQSLHVAKLHFKIDKNEQEIIDLTGDSDESTPDTKRRSTRLAKKGVKSTPAPAIRTQTKRRGRPRKNPEQKSTKGKKIMSEKQPAPKTPQRKGVTGITRTPVPKSNMAQRSNSTPEVNEQDKENESGVAGLTPMTSDSTPPHHGHLLMDDLQNQNLDGHTPHEPHCKHVQEVEYAASNGTDQQESALETDNGNQHLISTISSSAGTTSSISMFTHDQLTTLLCNQLELDVIREENKVLKAILAKQNTKE